MNPIAYGTTPATPSVYFKRTNPTDQQLLNAIATWRKTNTARPGFQIMNQKLRSIEDDLTGDPDKDLHLG